jgi:hypothetical protein
VTALTIKQFARLWTRRQTPPYNLTGLSKALGGGSVSLKSFLAKTSAGKAIVFVQLRDPSILQFADDSAQFQKAWSAGYPSQSTLSAFSKEVKSAGAEITYLSPDHRYVGVSGSVASLNSLNGILAQIGEITSGPSASGLAKDVITGGAIAGGGGGLVIQGVITWATASTAGEAAGLVIFLSGGEVVVGGLIVLGGLTYVVVSILDASNSSQSTLVQPGSNPDAGVPDGTVFGPPAPDVTPNTQTTTPVDVSTAPPPICPVSNTPLGPVQVTCPVGPGTGATGPVICPGGTSVCPGGF